MDNALIRRRGMIAPMPTTPPYVKLSGRYGIQLPYTPTINTEVIIWYYNAKDMGAAFRIPLTEDAGFNPYNYMSNSSYGKFIYHMIFQNNGYCYRWLNRKSSGNFGSVAIGKGYHVRLRVSGEDIGWKAKQDSDETCDFSWDDISETRKTVPVVTSEDWDNITANASGTLWILPSNTEEHLYSLTIKEGDTVIFDLKPIRWKNYLVNTIDGAIYEPKYVVNNPADNVLPLEDN